MQIKWTINKFDDLSAKVLYAIMQLRSEVFVVEQNCVYQDADNKDQASYHLCGWLNNELVAYCRILPKGLAYDDYASIGRVVSSPKYRNTGFGKLLIAKAIELTNNLYPNTKIKIGAQLYLKKFYQSFDFEQHGEGYLEDGIPHIPMLLKKS